jgi:hypothetical protein
MTTQASIVAEERRKKTEKALATILQSREAQEHGMDPDEVLHNLRKEIDSDVEINRAIVEKFLGDLLSQGKIEKNGADFRWNHHRGLCHTFTEGICKCCSTEKLLNPHCPICQAVNPV